MRCETDTLPDCEDTSPSSRLARLPADAGLHLLQVQNPHGLFSKDNSSACVTFDLAQSAVDVQIDDVGLYEGRGCGTP